MSERYFIIHRESCSFGGVSDDQLLNLCRYATSRMVASFDGNPGCH